MPFENVFIAHIPYVIQLSKTTRVDCMSESWIQECKTILDEINKLEDTKERDRLDMVRTIRFILFALQHSLLGWDEWVDNPDIMTKFSLEELKEISRNLAKLTQPFIEYDCEITSQAQRLKTLKEPEVPSESTKKAKDKTEIFYVK